MTGVLPAMQQVRVPVSVRLVAWTIVLLFIGMGVAMAFVPWQQSVSGNGRVIAMTPVERQQTVSSPVDGRVVKWHVVEGTRVKAGDPIVEIADNDPNVVDRLQSELGSAREREQNLADRIREVRNSRENALSAADARITMAAERVAAAERGLDQAEAALLLARQNLDRQKGLIVKGLTPTRQVEIAQEIGRAHV